MDQRVKPAPHEIRRRARRKSEDARARPRRPARHIGSRTGRRPLRRGRAAHRAARQRRAGRSRGRRRGDGADAQRKRRAREDRRLRQDRAPASTARWCLASTSTCASSRRSGRTASRSRSATATISGAACSSSTTPATRSTRCICGRHPISTPIRRSSAASRSADQSPSVSLKGVDEGCRCRRRAGGSVDDLRDRWSRMTDVHQFFGMLKTLKLSPQPGRAHGRRRLCLAARRRRAWPRCCSHAAPGAMPIMCFVGNRGCIQIHSGPVTNIKPMGPWLNVHGRDVPPASAARPHRRDCGRCASRPRTATSPRSKPMTPTAS